MATAARERLARMLRGETRSAFSVALTAQAEDLNLDVEGFGRAKLPVTPAKARKLVALGQPAMFGRGEETLTDAAVRDTWEVPRHLVHAEWKDAVLADILATVKEELGFPNASKLRAELHSLLVYEEGQFFLPHQDTEKSDDMVGTLVVSLPSRHAGGELVVSLGDERKVYSGSKTALSLVAFYADCRHEVRPLTAGYRVTLAYNLMLSGDRSRPPGEEGTVAEVASLLREHFDTPAPRYYGGSPEHPPRRLAYLLEHEYTPRGLGWSRLKGDDATNGSLLRAAADKAGCEAVLALADVQETHEAYSPDAARDYWHRDWQDEYDEDEDEDEDEFSDASDADPEYEIQGLLNLQVSLTHWTGADGSRLQEVSLFLGDPEICASSPSGHLTPYDQQYEGYMGNWGNTLDRWYHRAAVVVWPSELAFANRAEPDPDWALDELAVRAAASDLAGARSAAATLGTFWERAIRTVQSGGDTAGLLGKALRTAKALADPALAAMLLGPFRVGNLAAAHAKPLAEITDAYGSQWTAGVLSSWFGSDQSTGRYSGGPGFLQWTADRLPSLCRRLRAQRPAGTVVARQLLDLGWERIRGQIRSILALSPQSYRDGQLADLGRPLAVLLTAATAIDAPQTRDTALAYVRQQGDAMTTLEMSALRAAAAGRAGEAGSDHGLGELASDCARRLRGRLARPPREAGDWSVELPAGTCACALCGTLRTFLADKDLRTFDWPLAKDNRGHIHTRLDAAELGVTHQTRRQGRPYTLVLAKTDALITREKEARARDESDLDWLAAEWNTAGRTERRS